jgi:glucose/arabinose dehydrogenase
MRMNPDGTDLEIFARGIRNTVGFDWHPAAKELWFTENGRDWMGDDLPPDELNHAPTAGLHFGFPYFHGNQIPDPEFANGKNPAEFVPCAQELGPHVAALGMRFYAGIQFPDKYRNRIFIAEHGSWNRSNKSGYRITTVTLENAKPVAYETFADGFMKDGSVFGRPVDLEILDDGSMLLSDDFSHAIYRITWSPDS